MKHSVTRTIINQSAMGMESKQGARLDFCFQDKVIPETKTIPEYESALDKAVQEFFWYCSDDDIIAVLKDAKEHQSVPREYRSTDVRNFDTNGVAIRKASLGYNTEGKVAIKIYFTFGRVKITANKVEISGKPRLTVNLCKLIEAIQESITRIQKILK